jgi:hypothetical protein
MNGQVTNEHSTAKSASCPPLHFDSRTYIKAKIEGTMTVQALSLYLSENNPDATTQSDAKMYGGALRPWASAAVKPMFFTIVGSDSENP